MERLRTSLRAAFSGQGQLVLVGGEPGIGKTRLAEQVAIEAASLGMLVLEGACYEGEWAPPYGPFTQALTRYVRAADVSDLRAEAAFAGPVIARMVHALRERLPDLGEPPALAPDEEQFRLLDSVSWILGAISSRRGMMLILEDLQWADRDTIAMLRQIARCAPGYRMLILATYRAVGLESATPLAAGLGVLPTESACEYIELDGLDPAEVTDLLRGTMGLHTLSGDATARLPSSEAIESLARKIHADTDGNPFFVRAILENVVEQGDGSFPSQEEVWRAYLREVPKTLQHVIGHRLRLFTASTNRLLSIAAAVHGPFRFAIVSRLMGGKEQDTLDALDEAISGGILRAVGEDSYEFTHALFSRVVSRRTSPSRRARQHRRIAEALVQVYGAGALGHAQEIAYQYRLSATLPGSEAGVAYALAAADQAEKAASYSEVVSLLRVALDLAPADDPRRTRLLARLGGALIWALEFEAATPTVLEAAAQIAREEGRRAAAAYVAQAAFALRDGYQPGARRLAEQGLRYTDEQHDAVWALLKAVDLMYRDTSDSAGPNGPMQLPERREAGSLLHAAGIRLAGFREYSSREVLLSEGPGVNDPYYFFLVGDYRRGLNYFRSVVDEWERQGRVAMAAVWRLMMSRFHCARGEFDDAVAIRRQVGALTARLPRTSLAHSHLITAEDEWRAARDEGWDTPIPGLDPSQVERALLGSYYSAASMASIARIHARMGRVEKALAKLPSVLDVIDRAPGWAENYVRVVYDAAEALWLTFRNENAERIEENVREKVIKPDFRYPMTDARLAMARLCALQCRYEEATEWFGAARAVLDEQGARPLRAIVDHDEGLMLIRCGASDDRKESRDLLRAALRQFRAIGMPGWARRAEGLLDEEAPSRLKAQRGSLSPPPRGCAFRRAGDYWVVLFDRKEVHLRYNLGLHYLFHLLRQPHTEIHAIDLVKIVQMTPKLASQGSVDASEVAVRLTLGDAGPQRDERATREYRERLVALREELEEAEQMNDIGRRTELQREIEFFAAELTGTQGNHARSHSERARQAVTKAIKSALDKIRKQHPALHRHLTATIKRGYFCSYNPDPRHPIDWET